MYRWTGEDVRRRDFVAVAIAEMALVASVRRALAQNESVTVPTGQETPIRLLKDEPFQVYVAGITVNTEGQFGDLWPYAFDASLNVTRLTPCNETSIPCEPIHLRIDSTKVSQGQVYVLDFDHPITPAVPS